MTDNRTPLSTRFIQSDGHPGYYHCPDGSDPLAEVRALEHELTAYRERYTGDGGSYMRDADDLRDRNHALEQKLVGAERAYTDAQRHKNERDEARARADAAERILSRLADLTNAATSDDIVTWVERSIATADAQLERAVAAEQSRNEFADLSTANAAIAKEAIDGLNKALDERDSLERALAEANKHTDGQRQQSADYISALESENAHHLSDLAALRAQLAEAERLRDLYDEDRKRRLATANREMDKVELLTEQLEQAREALEKVEVDMKDPELLARAFWGMDDDAQARFFCAVAAFAKKSCEEQNAARQVGLYASPGFQWYEIGKHLRTCECSTQAGRDMVEEIYYAMTHKLEEAAPATGERGAAQEGSDG